MPDEIITKKVLESAEPVQESDDAEPASPVLNIDHIKLVNGVLASYRPGVNEALIYNAIYTIAQLDVPTLSAELANFELSMVSTANHVFTTAEPGTLYTVPVVCLRKLTDAARAETAEERQFFEQPERWFEVLAQYIGMDVEELTTITNLATGEPEIPVPRWRRLNPRQKSVIMSTFSQHGLLGLLGFKYMLENKALWCGGFEEARIAGLCLQAAAGERTKLSNTPLQTPGTRPLPGDMNMHVGFDQWLFWHLVALRWNSEDSKASSLSPFSKVIFEMIDCIENETLRNTLQLYYTTNTEKPNSHGLLGESKEDHFNF